MAGRWIGHTLLWGTLSLLVLSAIGNALMHSENRDESDTARLSQLKADQLNSFAMRHQMNVDEAVRWDFVMKQGGLSLADFDEALTRLGQSRDKAVGYHVQTYNKNPDGKRLHAGDAIVSQSPVTEDERNVLKLLRMAGY